MLTTSCPRCGAESPPRAARCRGCGFAFVEEAGRHRLPRPRPSGRLLALAAGGAAAAVAVVLLPWGGSSPRPLAAQAVPALEAERRLELIYSSPSDDETASVRCPRAIEPGRTVRCELRYRDGIARAMLVRLSPRGALEADIPYPATLR
jgi:hypothetical protein